ncbi:hypothetical protein D3C87_1298680 [compost metagenome]
MRIGGGLVHTLARPVRSAKNAPNATTPDFGIHSIDKFADRHVGIVTMHEIDIDIIRLQTLQRLVELLGDHVRIAEGRMRAFADQHDFFARHVAAGVPVTEYGFRLAAAIDISRIEQIAARLIKGIERQGRGGEIGEELETERNHRSGFGEAGYLPLRNRIACHNLATGNIRDARSCFFDAVFQANGGTPLVHDT